MCLRRRLECDCRWAWGVFVGWGNALDYRDVVQLCKFTTSLWFDWFVFELYDLNGRILSTVTFQSWQITSVYQPKSPELVGQFWPELHRLGIHHSQGLNLYPLASRWCWHAPSLGELRKSLESVWDWTPVEKGCRLYKNQHQNWIPSSLKISLK